MQFDFQADIPLPITKYDLCIIGAGAAGISIAHALIGSKLNICLLESGGFQYESETQALYEGASTGTAGVDPNGCRLRFFGGTTNHWRGYCAPLGEIDFKKRDWVENSGWPINKKDLISYYERACKICEIGSYAYFQDLQVNSASPPELLRNKLTLDNWQFSPPTRFGTKYRKDLEQAKNISIYLHSNVTRIDANQDASSIKKVTIQTLNGKSGNIHADMFVLACGGLENARLLLLSDNIEPSGLGNKHDNVGRYFNMHVEHEAVAHIISRNGQALKQYFEQFQYQSQAMMTILRTADTIQQKDKILNCGFTLYRPKELETGYSQAKSLLVEIYDKQTFPDDMGAKIWSVLSDLDGLSAALYTKLAYGKTARHIPALYLRAETVPNSDSRVTLDKTFDTLGLRKLKVNWKLTDFDKQSMRQSVIRVAEELGRLNLGRVQLDKHFFNPEGIWPERVWGGCHHMGTTRMSDDVTEGVVNRDCRVHSLNNLYIAGSSVFPTGGFATPTLTIVALALRLADHLKHKLLRNQELW
jgi:choline dehydrogenase-like flavoprotein